MTVPTERYNAVLRAQEFLMDLLDPKKTPKVPKYIRTRAYIVLRHYPARFELDYARDDYDNVFQNPERSRD